MVYHLATDKKFHAKLRERLNKRSRATSIPEDK
jgi:hypothetical protein